MEYYVYNYNSPTKKSNNDYDGKYPENNIRYNENINYNIPEICPEYITRSQLYISPANSDSSASKTSKK
jgi:hypothetical protein